MNSLIYQGKKILMRRGIYSVYLETPYFDLPDNEHIYLIETGESCHYVREYLTKKKIPVRHGKHYIYKDLNGYRKDTYEYKSKLVGPYKYPYFIEYNKVIIDAEYVKRAYKTFGLWIPIEIEVIRKYDYDFPNYEANVKSIEKYCEKHRDVKLFSSELDTIFSNSIDKYLEYEWPHQYIYGPDIYWYERETAKKRILKKL